MKAGNEEEPKQRSVPFSPSVAPPVIVTPVLRSSPQQEIAVGPVGSELYASIINSQPQLPVVGLHDSPGDADLIPQPIAVSTAELSSLSPHNVQMRPLPLQSNGRNPPQVFPPTPGTTTEAREDEFEEANEEECLLLTSTERSREKRSIQRKALHLVLDSGNAERNAREHYGDAVAERWHMDRAETVSEMSFSMLPFLKTFTYESLPTGLHAVAATWLDGYASARARGLVGDWGLSKLGTWFGWLYQIQTTVYLTLIIYWIYTEELPAAVPYEIIRLFLLVIGRAAVIGCKYALYGSHQYSPDVEHGLGSKTYVEGQQMFNLMMPRFIYNTAGNQKILLLNILHKSMVYADVDLSCALFDYGKKKVKTKDGREILVTVAILEQVEAHLQEFDIIGREDSEGAKGTPQGSDLDGKSAVRKKHELLDLHQCSFLKTYFREDFSTIRTRVASGRLPATVMAVWLVLEIFMVDQKLGNRIFYCTSFVPGLYISVLPILIRVFTSDHGDIWGSTEGLRWYYSVSLLPSLFTMGIMVHYVAAPAFWYYRQWLLSRRLLLQVAGEELSGQFTFNWNNSEKGESCMENLPRLDLRTPSNVSAWICLRRVLHGPAFGPTIALKFQIYSLIIVMVYLGAAAVQSFGAFLMHQDGLEGFGPDARASNISRMVLMALPISCQVLLAFWINKTTSFQMEALLKQQTANTALSEAVSDDCEVSEKILTQAADNIAAVVGEISETENSNPMKVLFYRAEPAVVSLVLSTIATILIIEIRGISF